MVMRGGQGGAGTWMQPCGSQLQGMVQTELTCLPGLSLLPNESREVTVLGGSLGENKQGQQGQTKGENEHHAICHLLERMLTMSRIFQLIQGLALCKI